MAHTILKEGKVYLGHVKVSVVQVKCPSSCPMEIYCSLLRVSQHNCKIVARFLKVNIASDVDWPQIFLNRLRP